MRYSTLGATGLRVSALGFGCGSTAALFTDRGDDEQYRATKAALEGGINFFDTAFRYAAGASEKALGATLAKLGSPDVVIGTKIRVDPPDFADVSGSVRSQVVGALQRLGRDHIDLLQLHNIVSVEDVTEPAFFQPLSITDIFERGVIGALEAVRAEGLVAHLGFSGIGEPAAVARLAESGAFETVQVYLNLLNPSAAMRVPPGFRYIDYGGLVGLAAQHGLGVIAIRVLAAGALTEGALRAPGTGSWGRRAWGELVGDRHRAEKLKVLRRRDENLTQTAIRFAMSRPGVSTTLVGFESEADVHAALAVAEAGPSFSEQELTLLRSTFEIS
jgi:aryl-alcohol dehydrogenase-like predicted oxidoreductase